MLKRSAQVERPFGAQNVLREVFPQDHSANTMAMPEQRSLAESGNQTMQVRDVMTREVISIRANESIVKAAQLMLDNRISGLPVTSENGELVGIVTEGDFLRRSEIGTQRHRPKWIELILSPGRLADDYVRASGRKVHEIMTSELCTVAEDDSLETVVELMERHRVKRLPVTRTGRVVGIVSRANLVHSLASALQGDKADGMDLPLRDRILAALEKQNWAPHINVVVRNGAVDLWGVVTDERERKGLIVAVENVAGVKEIHDHLLYVEPTSGMAFPSSEDSALCTAEMPAVSRVI